MDGEINLTFDLETGECLISAEGFKGDICEKATKFLSETLGTISDYRKKQSWYETNLQSTGTVNSNLCG